MKAKFFTLILLFIFSLGCTDRDDDVAIVNIRIKNTSAFTFGNVQVGDEESVHLNVAPGAYSPYLEYEEAYRYNYIRIEANEETYVLQPIDYVGETPLPVGFYTYELFITEEGDVQLTFKVD